MARYSKPLTGLLISFTLGLVFFLSACGDNSPTPASSPGVVYVKNTPLAPLSLTNCAALAVNATPAGKAAGLTAVPSNLKVEVPSGYRLFISSTFPYAAAIPEGWQVRENQSQGNLKGDLIIGEKSDTNVAAVTVISEKLENAKLDSSTYFQEKLKEITATQNLAVDKQGERKIGSATAYLIAYNTPGGQPFPYPVQTLQLVFTAEARGWVVSFTVTPERAAQDCAAFSKILDSWTFTGTAN